ncbi:hypothetical protein, partial [Hyphomonas sp.]|uniref:hypothetical protein n=1 Tax=Hyphomonas sp. TaxID=87 RepID=UPI00391CAB47
MKRTAILGGLSAASCLMLAFALDAPEAGAQTAPSSSVSSDDIGADGLKRRGDGTIDDNSDDSASG